MRYDGTYATMRSLPKQKGSRIMSLIKQLRDKYHDPLIYAAADYIEALQTERDATAELALSAPQARELSDDEIEGVIHQWNRVMGQSLIDLCRAVLAARDAK